MIDSSPASSNQRPSPDHLLNRQNEDKSLDLVQRTVISAVIGVVFGSFASVLALYLAIKGHHDLDRTSVVGLWIMTGLFGLVTAAAILVINRRRPYSPWVVLGLIPMLTSAYWVV